MHLEFRGKASAYTLILGLSCLLMLSLALVNGGYANDDHFTVIELIARFGVLPKSTQCWQCYHPKLYHFIIAHTWNLLGITSPFYKHISAQLFNALAGCATVYIFLRFIRPLHFPETLKILVFAFFAFNPRLISIFGQATNDGLIILLGTVNLYAITKIFHKPSLKYALLVIISLVLGSMAKLNFGVYFIGTLIVLVVLAILHRNYSFSLRKGYLGTAALGLLLSAFTFLSFNGYIRDYKENGKLFTYNTPTYDLPHLYELESSYIPGILSIYSGYFKFQYVDLIRNPHLSYTGEHRFKHLHSHFSQVYGHFYFLGFDNWPPQWQNDNRVITAIGKVSLAVGLIPVFLLFTGLFMLVKNLFRGWDNLKRDASWIYLLYIAGFLGFSVLFSLMGRTFVFMKAIYIFPGLLATVVPFLLGNAAFIKRKAVRTALYAFYIGLFVLYLVPVVYLIVQLGGKL
ncbi:MAG: glycosyltransferase family 39 protein [Leadbetterella sp.]|nr:glycosyltransferase family 39 protein [Leadbetterella sp.]